MKIKLTFLAFIFWSYSSLAVAQNNPNTSAPKVLEGKYSSLGIVLYVRNCTQSFYQYTGQNPQGNDQQFNQVIQWCSCVMDHFRRDYTEDQLNKQHKKIMPLMSPQYAAVCTGKQNEVTL